MLSDSDEDEELDDSSALSERLVGRSENCGLRVWDSIDLRGPSRFLIWGLRLDCLSGKPCCAIVGDGLGI